MCVAPISMTVGKGGDARIVQAACHNCWQCRENRINDWVGRCIAESKTAFHTHAVTLTYGRDDDDQADHLRAALLTYSDVQKYFKLLRRHGFPVRYFVTGEFGSAKGRAHWHVMVYWQEAVPAELLVRENLDSRITVKFASRALPGKEFQAWGRQTREGLYVPRGTMFYTEPTHAAVRYNCKYIMKDQGDDERQGHVAMSKKPPIGSAYFAQLAGLYVEQGLSPQSLEYRFPEVTDKDGKMVNFRLRDRSAELFLDAYLSIWRGVHGDAEPPRSQLLEEHLDPGAWKETRRGPGGPLILEPGKGPAWKFLDQVDWDLAWARESGEEYPSDPGPAWTTVQDEMQLTLAERRQTIVENQRAKSEPWAFQARAQDFDRKTQVERETAFWLSAQASDRAAFGSRSRARARKGRV